MLKSERYCLQQFRYVIKKVIKAFDLDEILYNDDIINKMCGVIDYD